MIYFSGNNKAFRPCNDEMSEAYKKYSAEIATALNSDISSKVSLGRALIDLWNSKSFCVKAEEHLDTFPNALITNCHQKVFFAVCESEFGLDKSQVSRFMNVVDEFGVENKLRITWKDFKWSALVEMLPLTPEEREKVKSDWTIKQIRDYKKSLEPVATSQQTEDEKEDDWKEPYEFRKLSRKELVQMIWKLNADRYRLYRIIEDNGFEIRTLESGEVTDFDYEAEYPAVDIEELLKGEDNAEAEE